MLVCSSPQLIAAYHVLLRLLEPRHPPCALICFKTIQIFYGVLPPLIDLKRSKSYSVLQLFFPICQRAIPRFQGLADVVDSIHLTAVFTASTPFQLSKELRQLQFGSQAILLLALHRAASRPSVGLMSFNGLRPLEPPQGQ
jgi:hypothetical protein